MKRYAIFGAGAIGGSLGAYMIKAGHDVLLIDIDKSHVDAINKNGLTVEHIDGNFTVHAAAITPSHIAHELDVVFLAVKSQHTKSAMDIIEPHLSKNGCVVSLQNGINEYIISDIIGQERTIGAFVNWAADYIEPGKIKFGGQSNFIIGEINGNISDRLLNLQHDLKCFLPVKVTDNIMGYLWSKQINISVMFATGITPLTITEGLDYPETKDVFTTLALEAMQVPKLLGVKLESFDDFNPELYNQKKYDEALQITADHYRHMVKNHTGLYRDLAVRKRPSEIDGTVGHTVIKGEQLGLSLPCNKKLVEFVHEIENGNRKIDINNIIELKNFININL